MTETITIEIDPKARQALDEIAAATERRRVEVLRDAIAAYLELHAWQAEHIRQALRDAEAGKFASDEEVKATFARWRD
jgi:predicted transcriptional regulator